FNPPRRTPHVRNTDPLITGINPAKDLINQLRLITRRSNSRSLLNQSRHNYLTISSEQFARVARAPATAPSVAALGFLCPFAPRKMQSAPHCSASSNNTFFGSPVRPSGTALIPACCNRSAAEPARV